MFIATEPNCDRSQGWRTFGYWLHDLQVRLFAAGGQIYLLFEFIKKRKTVVRICKKQEVFSETLAISRILERIL